MLAIYNYYYKKDKEGIHNVRYANSCKLQENKQTGYIYNIQKTKRGLKLTV